MLKIWLFFNTFIAQINHPSRSKIVILEFGGMVLIKTEKYGGLKVVLAHPNNPLVRMVRL